MPIPPAVRKFGQLSKAENAATTKALDEMMTLPDGRAVSKRMFLEFEIEKALQAGRSQSDIMKSLDTQGLKGIDPNYVKGRIGVARHRNARLKTDPRYAGMEATWIIENGLHHKKTWEEISDDLITSGFNGPRLTEVYKDYQAKRIQQGNSAPAVIDKGTFNNQAKGAIAVGGAVPGASIAAGLEEDAQQHPTEKYKDLRGMSQADLSKYLMEGFNEAKLRLGEGKAQPMEGIDLDMMTETIKMWGEGVTDSGSRVKPLDLNEGVAPRGQQIERPTGLEGGPQ